jgi:hypothetical protein
VVADGERWWRRSGRCEGVLHPGRLHSHRRCRVTRTRLSAAPFPEMGTRQVRRRSGRLSRLRRDRPYRGGDNHLHRCFVCRSEGLARPTTVPAPWTRRRQHRGVTRRGRGLCQAASAAPGRRRSTPSSPLKRRNPSASNP